MEVDELLEQTASIMRQLEVLKDDCDKSGNVVGGASCQMAITALSVIVERCNPPKPWSAPVALDNLVVSHKKYRKGVASCK